MPPMTPLRFAPLLLTGIFTLAGCAGAAAPSPAPAPLATEPRAAPPTAGEARPTAETDPLSPPEAALRAAERIQLTGLETGTMWTFENPPLAYWDTVYGFRPDQEWLDRVRLASVRYGRICSASFVSAAGLVMTNHHCARDCAEAVSTDTLDLVAEGFYAATRAEELVCPELYLDQLVKIEDVSRRVKEAAPADAPDSVVVAAQAAERERIEAACEAESGLACQVVSLYRGGQHQLYTYRRYSPVKLVFLPELDAGFFGGDPDNFTYPRYALDVAFVRAYEEETEAPATTPHHFGWDPGGAGEGELVFITGNPGSTSRLATVSQLMYERHYRHPFIVTLLEGQRALLRSLASRGPEMERAVRDDLFSVENSLKAFTGQLRGLLDTLLIGRKIRWERELRARVAADSTLAHLADIWDRMAEIQAGKLATSPRLNVNNPQFLGGPYEEIATTLVRYVQQIRKPESERDDPFRGEALGQTEARLRGPVQADLEVASRLLELRLEVARRFLPAGDPFLSLAFRSERETAAGAARRLIRETALLDAAFRRRIIEGGPEALIAATDPLLALAAQMVEALPPLERRWDELRAAESVQEERLAEALFAVFGTDIPPDATFTLRISDGVVRRYPYNGTFAPPHTTFFGLFARASEFGNEPPWTLPASFVAHRAEIRMSTPLNFVTTNDITGGNSGSPMIDREARIVGLAFDGNIEQLPNEFLFTTRAARAVGVHSAGILEALRSVYGAEALYRELLGGSDPEP